MLRFSACEVLREWIALAQVYLVDPDASPESARADETAVSEMKVIAGLVTFESVTKLVTCYFFIIVT